MDNHHHHVDIQEEIENIKQRLEAIENNTDDDDAKHFSYPHEAVTYIVTEEQLRYVNHSLYEVWIIKPYPADEDYSDPPLIIKATMTREELDEYISKNPGKNFGEYIFEVTPTLKQYL